MKAPVYTHRLSAIIFGSCFCVLTANATQAPVTSPPTVPLSAATSDSGVWRRDPFIGSLHKDKPRPTQPKTFQLKAVSGSQTHDQEQDLQLQGIMLVDKAYHALINGRTVKTGDKIGGVIIQHISRYQVVVLNEHKEKIFYDIYQGRIDRGKK